MSEPPSSIPPGDRVPVPGSEREPLPGARVVGPARSDEQIQVTVLVRRREPPDPRAAAAATEAVPPRARRYLTRAELAATRGASPDDLARIEAFARANGLDVVEVNAARRSVVLAGTVAQMSRAFGVQLLLYEYPGGVYRGRSGPVVVPADLAPVVEGVFGLDDRPQASPHFRRADRAAGTVRPRAVSLSYTPLDVAALYDFPSGLDGRGQCIAIVELGGGYTTKDLDAYFSQLGVPRPTVTAVSVDGAQNRPTGDPNGPDSEVLLDIEVAGAIAPGAQIAVYFAPNTDQGFLDAVTTAIHDTQLAPSVLSISWGKAETTWTAQALRAFDQAFQDAAALGVTVCCAAGDDGSRDGIYDGRAHVDFPASSPHVLACGGTRLEAAQGAITRETVWNDGPDGGATGGGVSERFGLPDWQAGASVPPAANPGGAVGRGVPDVAGNADPETGYQVLIDGEPGVIGGTSAVAPLWAGLVARLNQQLAKPVGFLNPLLYGPLAAAGALHDITSGNNGAYAARIGWDACTGLGSPDGAKILQGLSH